MKYRWLLFDADGTLFDYDKAEAVALRAAFADLGYALDPDCASAYQEINARLWLEFEQGTISQADLRVRRFERLLDTCRLKADPEQFSSTYLQRLGQGTFLIEGALELLQALDGRVNMAIITNGLQDVQRSRFSLSPIGPYFSPIIISEEVGAAKPDGRIFDVTFSQMGHPALNEVLIIGDSLSSDMKGGRLYGIDTCWFNPAGQPRPDDAGITYEINYLPDLLPLIE